MREIPLVNSALSAFVDDCDYDELIRYRWYQTTNKHGNIYAKRNDGYKQTLMHRDILGLTDKMIWVDHKDFNGLHNWRDNLRLSTPQQNCARCRRPVGISGYRGVAPLPSGRWSVRIRNRDQGKLHVGTFDTAEEAARAYDKKALEILGEFALLNFPDDEKEEARAA